MSHQKTDLTWDFFVLLEKILLVVNKNKHNIAILIYQSQNPRNHIRACFEIPANSVWVEVNVRLHRNEMSCFQRCPAERCQTDHYRNFTQQAIHLLTNRKNRDRTIAPEAQIRWSLNFSRLKTVIQSNNDIWVCAKTISHNRVYY